MVGNAQPCGMSNSSKTAVLPIVGNATVQVISIKYEIGNKMKEIPQPCGTSNSSKTTEGKEDINNKH